MKDTHASLRISQPPTIYLDQSAAVAPQTSADVVATRARRGKSKVLSVGIPITIWLLVVVIFWINLR